MNKILFSLLLIGCHVLAMAGNGIDLTRRNAVYFEGGGSGFLGSLNYERIFDIKKKPRLCARIGLALHPDVFLGVSDAETVFITTIGASILSGGSEKDFFEAGLSWTHDYNTYKSYVYESSGIYAVDTYHDNYFFIYLGYRYHSKSGFMLRAAITPAFSYRKDIHQMEGETGDRKLEAAFWAGVSMGYLF